MHDGNYGGSCRGTERETQNKYILRFIIFFFYYRYVFRMTTNSLPGQLPEYIWRSIKAFYWLLLWLFITSVKNFLPLFIILSVTKWEFNFPRQT